MRFTSKQLMPILDSFGIDLLGEYFQGKTATYVPRYRWNNKYTVSFLYKSEEGIKVSMTQQHDMFGSVICIELIDTLEFYDE